MGVMSLSSRIGALLVTVTVTVALAACGGDGGNGDSAAADSEKEPLRVAVVSQFAGPLAQYGNDVLRAWQLAAEQVNADGGVAGHRVEIVKSEARGDPDSTIRAARNTVVQDDVQYLTGVLLSQENAALAPQLVGMGALNIATVPKDDSLTGESCSPNMYRISTAAGMDSRAMLSYLPELQSGKWAILALDILLGHSSADAFEQAAEEAGMEVVSKQFAPLGTTEFGSYISKIESSGADGLFVLESGADAVAFVQQAKQFQLFDSIETTVSQSMLADPLFEAMGDTIAGWYGADSYMAAIDTPENQEFVSAWKKKYGSDARLWNVPADAYVGAQVLFEAVRKADSIELEDVKAAMDGVTIETLTGELRMRPEDHQALRPSYVSQIEQDGKDLRWKVVSSVKPDQTSPAPNPDCKL